MVKNLPTSAGDMGSIPGSGRSLGVGNGNPIQYSCLENSMENGASQATVHGVTELDTTEQLSCCTCATQVGDKDRKWREISLRIRGSRKYDSEIIFSQKPILRNTSSSPKLKKDSLEGFHEDQGFPGISVKTWHKGPTFFFFCHSMQHVESYFPDEGSNLSLLYWKHRVLTTGLPGKSQGQMSLRNKSFLKWQIIILKWQKHYFSKISVDFIFFLLC